MQVHVPVRVAEREANFDDYFVLVTARVADAAESLTPQCDGIRIGRIEVDHKSSVVWGRRVQSTKTTAETVRLLDEDRWVSQVSIDSAAKVL